MSPEQWAGDIKAVGPLSDVYSLGVILYRLLTGEHPYSGMVLEIMAQACSGNPRPPSTVRTDLDPALDTICLRAMAVDQAVRYPSAKALADALSGYLKGVDGGDDDLPVGEPLPDEPPRRGLPAGLTPASGHAPAVVPTRGVAPDPTPRSPRRPAPAAPEAASELVMCPRCRARLRVAPSRAKPVPCPMCNIVFSVGAGRQAAARAVGGGPVGTRSAEARAAPEVYDLPDDDLHAAGTRPEWRPVAAGLMLAWVGPVVALLFAGLTIVYLIATATERKGRDGSEYAAGQLLLAVGAAAGMALGGVGRWRAALGSAGRLSGLAVLFGTAGLTAAYGFEMRSTWYGVVYLPEDPEVAIRQVGTWVGVCALIAAEIAFYVQLAGIGRRVPDFPHMHAATTRVLFLLVLVPTAVFAALVWSADPVPVSGTHAQPPPWRVGASLISGCGALGFFPLWVLAAFSLTVRAALAVRGHARGR